ncbi:MAG: hypothetical protein ACFE0O_08445 [Opitutales bacterium]
MPTCPQPGAASNRSGFALILALALTSLLVLLLLGLTALVRSSSEANRAGLRQLAAREAARLAALEAVGQLQRHLGPDARVTTQGRFRPGTRPEHAVWTAAWDTTDLDAGPVWLVSQPSTGVDPADASADPATLLPARDNGAFSPVQVPVQTLPEARLRRAWWIGDRSNRVSLRPQGTGSGEGFDPADSPAAYPLQANRPPEARGALPGGADLRHAVPDWDRLDPAFTDRLPALDRLRDLTTVEFLAEADPDLVLPDTLDWRDDSHRYTAEALGLAANTLPPGVPGAGLQRDLSLAGDDLLGTAFIAWRDADFALNQANDLTVGGADGLPWPRRNLAPPQEDGAFIHSIAPVLSEVMLPFTVRRDPDTDQLQVRAKLFVELWNPWLTELMVGPAHSGSLELEIRGLPTVQILGEGTASVDLQAALGNPADPDNVLTIELPVDPDEDRWLPGRVMNWAQYNAPLAPGRYAADRQSKDWESDEAEILLPDPAPGGDEYRWQVNQQTTLDLRLVYRNRDGELATLVALDDAAFPAFLTDPNDNPESAGMRFAFRFRLQDPYDSWLAPDPRDYGAFWLQAGDPRDANPVFSDQYLYGYEDEADPALYDEENPGFLATVQPLTALDRGGGSSGRRQREDVLLYPAPGGRLFSAAQLRHLQRLNPLSRGPFAAAAPVEVRNALDRYFASGLRADDLATGWDGQSRLPHRFLRPVAPSGEPVDSLDGLLAAAPPDRAAHWQRRGVFNIHTLSVEAWRALLGGIRLEDWAYVDASATTGQPFDRVRTETLPAAFGRFGGQAGVSWDLQAPPPVSEFDTKAFQRGLTLLSDDQVTALAEAIVDGLVARNGRPFTGLGAFAGPGDPDDSASLGLLATALDATLADADGLRRWDVNLQAGPGGTVAIPRIEALSPAWISQADVLEALLPQLTARGDHFEVIAYGAITDPFDPDRVLAESRVKLDVLRVAEPVDPDDSLANPDPDGFGRRFVILNWTWLPAL